MIKHIFIVALCLGLCAPNLAHAGGGGGDDETVKPENMDLIARLDEQHHFETLIKALKITGLSDVITSDKYSIFAPNDHAFEKLPEGYLKELIGPEDEEDEEYEEYDRSELKYLLEYHILKGKVGAQNFSFGITQIQTMNKASILFESSEDGKPSINGLKAKTLNIKAKNGFIHELDTVLTPPPRAEEDPDDHH